MKKTILFLFAAVVLGASCSKEEVTQPEGCYMCTDIKQLYRDGVPVGEPLSITAGILLVPVTDTTKTPIGLGEYVWRYMSCVKIIR